MARSLRFTFLIVLLGSAGMLFPGLTSAEGPLGRGIRAYRAGDCDRARELLRPIVLEHPARTHPKRGAAAYWLGRAYGACEQPDSMRWAWNRGVEAFREVDQFDARLFDAAFWSQWEWSGSSRQSLADLYLTVLHHVGKRERQSERQVLRRYVAQMMPLMSASERKRILGTTEKSVPEEPFSSSMGQALVEWWQRHDVIPATERNERLFEHFRRVHYARSEYKDDEAAAGWDARGDLYVRYGAPSRTHKIPFDDMSFLKGTIRSGVGVQPGDFPDSVIWRYSQLGEEGVYLLVESKGSYEIGRANDLLPSKLKRSFDSSDRSLNRAYSSVVAIQYIYEHLSMHYHDTGNVYEKATAYLNAQRQSSPFSASGEVGFGSGQKTIYRGPGRNLSSPSVAANEVVHKSRQHERQFAKRREKNVPQQYTESTQSSLSAPIAVRTARFLDEDGETQTEVYWGGPRASLIRPGNSEEVPYLLRVTSVQYAPTYRRQVEQTVQYPLQHSAEGRLRRSLIRRMSVGGATDLYHLATQWDVYAIKSGLPMARGEHVGRRVVRSDSLRPLQADPSQLEMSDLRLMAIPEGPTGAAPSVEKALPYPYDTATPQTPLVLYFELYHLGRSAQNRTRYAVTYEATRRTEKGFFGRLFGSEKEQVTSASTEYSGRQRRTEEYIQLDLGTDPDEKQATEITVEVTDEVTGQSVERSISLTLVPPGDTS